MTNSAKQRGDRAERELAALLAEHLGVRVRRKLGAGRADDAGDLDGLACAVQVRDYRDVLRAINTTVADLPGQIANSDHTLGVGFVRRPGGRWVAVMGVAEWCAWYREATT